jgi:hypothetical protein
LTDTLTEFFSTGKASFSDFASSIMKDITKMIVKSQITLPLMNMLGMGSGQTAMQQTGQGNLMSSLANQGVSLFSGAATNGGGTNVVNGDGNVATNSKTASQSVGKLGSTTASTTEGVSSLGTAVVGVGGALSNVSTAVGSQTKAIMSNIFSMKGLQTASNALMFTFAAMSASSSSKTSKWLGFAGTVASGVASIYAGGGFSGGGSGGGSGESPAAERRFRMPGQTINSPRAGLWGRMVLCRCTSMPRAGLQRRLSWRFSARALITRHMSRCRTAGPFLSRCPPKRQLVLALVLVWWPLFPSPSTFRLTVSLLQAALTRPRVEGCS